MKSTIYLSLLMAISGSRAAPVLERAVSCDASDLSQIVGYTAITSTNVVGDFEGADYDKSVKLDNGMIFEFTEYNYAYSYRPDVIVFARAVTLQGRSVTVYKLMVEDELYDARRVR
jgi:hypothetical protein